jgi:hypothetical protein
VHRRPASEAARGSVLACGILLRSSETALTFWLLPPADGSFLEQRRRSLQRYLNFVANHPTLKADHLVQVFLSEPNLEVWRKNKPIALDEEGKGKRLTDREEQSIPDDSDQRLAWVSFFPRFEKTVADCLALPW